MALLQKSAKIESSCVQSFKLILASVRRYRGESTDEPRIATKTGDAGRITFKYSRLSVHTRHHQVARCTLSDSYSSATSVKYVRNLWIREIP